MVDGVIAIGLLLLGVGLVLLGCWATVRRRNNDPVQITVSGVTIRAREPLLIIILGLVVVAGSGSFAFSELAGEQRRAGTAQPTAAPTDTTQTTTAAQPSVSRSADGPTPTAVDVASLCRAAVAALTAEVSAIDEVRAQVVATEDVPTRTTPAYAAAAARQRSANTAAGQAWAAFEAAGLTAQTDQVVPVVLGDVNDFVAALPGAITGDRDRAAEIWSALNDRPKVLREKVVPAVARQCARI